MLSTFKYMGADNKMKQRSRATNVRNGFYCYDLFDYQQKIVDDLPGPNNSYLFEAPIGIGKTRMLAKVAENTFKANEEHTVCMIVTASASQMKVQMREFGDVNEKPYTQTLDSDNRKNTTAFNLKNTAHPTICVTPQMFSRLLGGGSKRKAVTDDETEEATTMLNQMRLISELGPDTRHLLIIIDEVHDVYASKYGKNKNAVKHSTAWRSVFNKAGINVTLIGATATLNLQEGHAIKNACRLFDVKNEDELLGIVHVASDKDCKEHTAKVEASASAKVTKKMITRKFSKLPAQVNKDLASSLDDMQTILVGSEICRHYPSFRQDLPRVQIDLAFKNCVTDICAKMMLEEGYIEKYTNPRKLVEGRRMNSDGEWEEVKLYPNAVVFFQTDRMRSIYTEQVLRRNEDDEEVKVTCTEMPSTPNDAQKALEDFNDNRLVQDDVEEDIPSVLLCPSRVFRKGTNLFTRFPPSTVILVGNFSKSEIRQMQGRFGRFCQKFEEGDIIPTEPIKIVNIPLRFAELMVSKLASLRDRSRASSRNLKHTEELLAAYSRFCDIEQYDDIPDCRVVKVSADTLQTISELDVPTKSRDLGVDFLDKLTSFSKERDFVVTCDTFFRTVTRVSSFCTSEEWDEDDHCFEQGLATFAEKDVSEEIPEEASDAVHSAAPSTSAAEDDPSTDDVTTLPPLAVSPP